MSTVTQANLSIEPLDDYLRGFVNGDGDVVTGGTNTGIHVAFGLGIGLFILLPLYATKLVGLVIQSVDTRLVPV